MLQIERWWKSHCFFAVVAFAFDGRRLHCNGDNSFTWYMGLFPSFNASDDLMSLLSYCCVQKEQTKRVGAEDAGVEAASNAAD
ncbi:hypothetical protein Fmac_033052 [Flemingia macrophylla]|uniref:Uncharacterized protein n=1 Tax=Flemingia macrophylla TaxID=520843 RepID=A0ABD1L6P5_9FABA